MNFLNRRRESVSAQEIISWIDRELSDENLGIGTEHLKKAKVIVTIAIEDLCK